MNNISSSNGAVEEQPKSDKEVNSELNNQEAQPKTFEKCETEVKSIKTTNSEVVPVNLFDEVFDYLKSYIEYV